MEEVTLLVCNKLLTQFGQLEANKLLSLKQSIPIQPTFKDLRVLSMILISYILIICISKILRNALQAAGIVSLAICQQIIQCSLENGHCFLTHDIHHSVPGLMLQAARNWLTHS